MIDWKKKIEEIKKTIGIKSNRQLEIALELSNGYIADIFNGKNNNPSKMLLPLYEKFRISPTWMLTDTGPMVMDDHALSCYRIPVLKQKASAGPGQDWQSEENIERYLDSVLDLSKSFRKIKPYAFEVRGGSMAGIGIHDGDIVIFDPHPATLPDDIYVYALDGGVFVKYIVFDEADKTITTYSCMPDGVHKQVAVIHPDDPADAERFHLFGRVIAWLHENHLVRR